MENFSSVSSTFDLNSLSVLTTVCGMSSRFVQVTVVPAVTVTSAGPKREVVDLDFGRRRRRLRRACRDGAEHRGEQRARRQKHPVEHSFVICFFRDRH